MSHQAASSTHDSDLMHAYLLTIQMHKSRVCGTLVYMTNKATRKWKKTFGDLEWFQAF